MKNINLLFLLCCIFYTSYGQNRDIIWVPGIGKTDADMNFYRNHVSSTYANTTDFAFDPPEGAINNMALNLQAQITASNTSIAIGHSLGGVVLRQLDAIASGEVGGIITVGSPNRGAPILNSVRNGSVEVAVMDGCNKLVNYPLSKISGLLGIFTKTLVQSLFGSATKPGLEFVLCTNLKLVLMIFKPNIVEDYVALITQQPYVDLRSQSNALNTLNATPSTLPQISITGEESGPEHWRIASTFSTQELQNNYQGNDYRWVNIMKNVRNAYNIAYITETSVAIVAAVVGIFTWWNPKGWKAWFIAASALYSSRKAKKGRDWFDKSEYIWETLIGSRNITETRTGTYTVDYYRNCLSHGYTGSTGWINCVTACGKTINGCYYTRSFTYSVTIDKNNDGLLSTHHQEIPGLDDDDIYIARGVNHLEMLDARGSSFKRPNIDDEMQETYDDIFCKKASFRFFQTYTLSKHETYWYFT